MIKRKQLVPASKAAQDLESICNDIRKVGEKLHKAGLYREAEGVEKAYDACIKAGVALEYAARERYAAERRGEAPED